MTHCVLLDVLLKTGNAESQFASRLKNEMPEFVLGSAGKHQATISARLR